MTLSRSTHPFPLQLRDLGFCQRSSREAGRGRCQKVLGLALNCVQANEGPGAACAHTASVMGIEAAAACPAQSHQGAVAFW